MVTAFSMEPSLIPVAVLGFVFTLGALVFDTTFLQRAKQRHRETQITML